MMMKNEASQVEETAEPNPRGIKDLWWARIQDEGRKHKDFKELADTAQCAYDKELTYNIMWPTCEITSASLYSDTPNPEVTRRQKNGDKAQKDAALVVERGIDYCVDNHDFDGEMQLAIMDYLVAGNGIPWVVYDAQIGVIPGGEPIEAITGQMVRVEHVSWEDFGWQPCKTWEDCEWVYRKCSMTRRKAKSRWNVELAEDEADDDANCSVYEIWDKDSRAIITISDQFSEPLEVRDDALGLEGFFPCPQPMMTNIKTNKLLPSPDYKYYQVQYKQLDKVSKRINGLIESTKAIKYYDASFQELAKLKTARDGNYIPVSNLIDKLEGTTNLQSVIAENPLEHNANVIQMLVDDKEYLKQEVFDILGISDIMRGESNPAEGVETQQLKSEYGAIRIRKKQSTVDRTCRDVFRIMGEIIAEHFEPEILQLMTGVEITPEVLQILKNDFMRNVSIDIETDSTNAGDKLRRRKAQNEAMQTLVGGLAELLTGMQSGVLPQPLGVELIKLLIQGVDGNTGNLEDIVNNIFDQGTPEGQLMQMQQVIAQLKGQIQQMGAELEKNGQAATAKDMTQAKLNDARAEETLSKIPVNQTEAQQNIVETDGKRVEQAANMAAGVTGRENWLRGIE